MRRGASCRRTLSTSGSSGTDRPLQRVERRSCPSAQPWSAGALTRAAERRRAASRGLHEGCGDAAARPLHTLDALTSCTARGRSAGTRPFPPAHIERRARMLAELADLTDAAPRWPRGPAGPRLRAPGRRRPGQARRCGVTAPAEGGFAVPLPRNEPVKGYAPGSPERAALAERVAELRKDPVEALLRIGSRDVGTGRRSRCARRTTTTCCSPRCTPPAASTSPTRSTRRWPPRATGPPPRSASAPRSCCAPPTCWPARGATRSTPRRCSGSPRPCTRPRSTPPASSIDFWRFNVAYAEQIHGAAAAVRRRACGTAPTTAPSRASCSR